MADFSSYFHGQSSGSFLKEFHLASLKPSLPSQSGGKLRVYWCWQSRSYPLLWWCMKELGPPGLPWGGGNILFCRVALLFTSVISAPAFYAAIKFFLEEHKVYKLDTLVLLCEVLCFIWFNFFHCEYLYLLIIHDGGASVTKVIYAPLHGLLSHHNLWVGTVFLHCALM